MNHPLSDMIATTMEKLQTMVDTNTVVGDPIVTADGTTVIPITKVSYGIAGGGSDFTTKTQKGANPFGGGAGASVTLTPVAFLIIKDGVTRMVPVAVPAVTAMDRIIEKAPEAAEWISSLIGSKTGECGEA